MTAQAGSVSSPLLNNVNNDVIRRAMRRQRRNLSAVERHLAALKVAGYLSRLPLIKTGVRIAVYLAINGELDLSPFISLARRRHCKLYLPRIVNIRTAHMEFFAFDAKAKLRRNVFGICEPISSSGKPISPQRLDLVLAPLLAFDVRGGRLGMGAGYYDRCLSFMRQGAWRRPKLIGIAYDFQRVPHLDMCSWDVHMDAVITESGMHRALSTVIRPSP